MDYSDWNFISGKSEMLGVLMNSKQQNSSVAILAPSIASDMFITAVDDILLEDGKTIIIFKQYDMTGYILPSTKVALDDLESVCPFSSEFRNPYLENYEKNRSWYF
jgi:hypothetical protein